MFEMKDGKNTPTPRRIEENENPQNILFDSTNEIVELRPCTDV